MFLKFTLVRYMLYCDPYESTIKLGKLSIGNYFIKSLFHVPSFSYRKNRFVNIVYIIAVIQPFV